MSPDRAHDVVFNDADDDGTYSLAYSGEYTRRSRGGTELTSSPLQTACPLS